MPAPSDPTHTVEVTCPGCFHPQQWDASAACPICHHRANAGRSAALLPVGTQLKGYVIGEKLGQGGFGITYRGFDLTLKMKVAIKEYYPSEFVGRSTNRKAVVLNGQDHEDLFQYGLKTFLKEAQTIAQLRHPHLVRVFNYFELNETAYLVMDYLEGEDLSRHLKPPRGQRGIQMPWPRAVKLLLPVLEGLYRVHQAGFMHRDLKPGNLYLTKDDELIVLDFGSARQVTSNHTRSLLIFSEGYAPYEQYLEGQLTRQGPWTDVYAIAATLYFMLTGCRLPSAMKRKEAQLLQQPDPLKPARHFAPELPAALDAVLMRALVVEPELRLPTVVDLKQQLERVLAQAEPIAPLELATVPLAAPPPKPKVVPEPPKPTPQPEAPKTPPPPKPEVASEPPRRTTPAPGGATPPYSRGTGHNLTWIVIVALIGIGLAWGGWWIGKTSSAPPKSPETPVAPVVVAPPIVQAAPVTKPTPPTPAILAFEPKMVRITGGSFQMGSPTSETGRDSDEKQHRVTVKDFEIGQYEVTQAQWQAVMGNNPSHFQGCTDCPVENVSWNDVQDYLEKLNRQTGKNYRLPTEAEWEYACRGGVAGQRYCGGNNPDRVAWYDGNSDSKTHPVGQKTANDFGLYDMSGNVWEWTCSAYDSDYSGSEKECKINDTGDPLAVRGGGLDDTPAWVRSALRYRGGYFPASRLNYTGFRLARSL